MDEFNSSMRTYLAILQFMEYQLASALPTVITMTGFLQFCPKGGRSAM